MIFITLGSQKFQFNRILKEVDELINQGIILESVFAQIGSSNYLPKNYSYKKFLSRDEYIEKMRLADIVLTHGGSGAIINALKSNKKTIAVPRLKKFNEHVDDHQLQIVNSFVESGYIMCLEEIGELSIALTKVQNIKLKKFESNNEKFIEKISYYLEGSNE